MRSIMAPLGDLHCQHQPRHGLSPVPPSLREHLGGTPRESGQHRGADGVDDNHVRELSPFVKMKWHRLWLGSQPPSGQLD
ncbi:hypothetical protein BS78_06G037200 [Paspalum vaginatum]|nr:hypothetical protein BS78_06G037200 [Paspalum vaginatum]